MELVKSSQYVPDDIVLDRFLDATLDTVINDHISLRDIIYQGYPPIDTYVYFAYMNERGDFDEIDEGEDVVEEGEVEIIQDTGNHELTQMERIALARLHNKFGGILEAEDIEPISEPNEVDKQIEDFETYKSINSLLDQLDSFRKKADDLVLCTSNDLAQDTASAIYRLVDDTVDKLSDRFSKEGKTELLRRVNSINSNYNI